MAKRAITYRSVLHYAQEIFLLRTALVLLYVCLSIVTLLSRWERNREKSVKRDNNCRSITVRSCHIHHEAKKDEGVTCNIRKIRYRETPADSSDNRLIYIYIYCYVMYTEEGGKTWDFINLSISVFLDSFDFHFCFLFDVGFKSRHGPSFVSPTLLSVSGMTFP